MTGICLVPDWSPTLILHPTLILLYFVSLHHMFVEIPNELVHIWTLLFRLYCDESGLSLSAPGQCSCAIIMLILCPGLTCLPAARGVHIGSATVSLFRSYCCSFLGQVMFVPVIIFVLLSKTTTTQLQWLLVKKHCYFSKAHSQR